MANDKTLKQIECALADMLDAYAGLRATYIPRDCHSLAPGDREIANEVAGIRQAAYMIRNRGGENTGIGLPSWLWDDWEAKQREVSEQLAEFLVVPRSESIGP
ncbi:hypothetical protein [Nocardia sp. NPDC052566]|uniref:hypothetical protein n=1 Tax=Nocardia sp. NPDC052566 TaxID=3364330 RepID=UPI0037C7B06A